MSISVWFLGQGVDWPSNVRQALLVTGGVGLMASLLFETGKWLLRHLPLPWFPNRWWRMLSWVKERPRLRLLVMNPPGVTQSPSGLIEGCSIGLTLQEDTTHARVNVTIRYDAAVLILRQQRNGERLKFIFRPVDAGGFLSEPQNPSSRNVIVTFVWTGGPQKSDHAPNFSADYEFRVTGIRGILQKSKALSGELPALAWRREHLAMSAGSYAPVERRAMFS
ncbi:MAG: hypothetical protein JNJ73_19880 [Hyphomonadaceae bacterium]|nr:hypothetical protein [Hyphomonadaceae bacterium]